jgi:hypothetical protein
MLRPHTWSARPESRDPRGSGVSARAIRRIALALLSLCAAGACDLEAGPDQELVLGNRGLVVAFERPNAVTVRPGGSLVV